MKHTEDDSFPLHSTAAVRALLEERFVVKAGHMAASRDGAEYLLLREFLLSAEK